MTVLACCYGGTRCLETSRRKSGGTLGCDGVFPAHAGTEAAVKTLANDDSGCFARFCEDSRNEAGPQTKVMLLYQLSQPGRDAVV